jgi:hypothetical protein
MMSNTIGSLNKSNGLSIAANDRDKQPEKLSGDLKNSKDSEAAVIAISDKAKNMENKTLDDTVYKNLSASETNELRDFVKNEILNQPAAAIQAQSNLEPQRVLSLLK